MSRPPRSALSPNTGSLCKSSPIAETGSQLGDVCARHVGDVETAQMYVRTRAAPRVAAHRSGWAGVATSASATAFTRAERRQTMNWAVMLHVNATGLLVNVPRRVNVPRHSLTYPLALTYEGAR